MPLAKLTAIGQLKRLLYFYRFGSAFFDCLFCNKGREPSDQHGRMNSAMTQWADTEIGDEGRINTKPTPSAALLKRLRATSFWTTASSRKAVVNANCSEGLLPALYVRWACPLWAGSRHWGALFR